MSRLVVAIAVVLSLAACKKESKPAATPPAAPGKVNIQVTGAGFTPDHVKVTAGQPVTLVFERKTDSTCAKQVVIPLDGQTITKDLPLDTPVEIAVTFPKSGEITYACGMDMVKGVITVQ